MRLQNRFTLSLISLRRIISDILFPLVVFLKHVLMTWFRTLVTFCHFYLLKRNKLFLLLLNMLNNSSNINITVKKQKRSMLNIRNVFQSSNEKLKKLLFKKIQGDISRFNNEARNLGFFQNLKKNRLLRTKLEILLALKQCQLDHYLLSKFGITLFPPKFGYKFKDNNYSGVEFCQFLLELQYDCNSQFPVSLDIDDQDLVILEEYRSDFKEFFEENSWLYFIRLMNKIINFFLEDNIDKDRISRDEIWDVLTRLKNIKTRLKDIKKKKE